MSRVTGLAPRGSTTRGFRPPAGCCNTSCRGSSLLRSRPSLLHPEHRTSGGQCFELFWSAGDTVELPKKLDPMRHLAWELSQDGGALLKGQLHKVYALLISASRQGPPPRDPHVLYPVCSFETGDDVTFAFHHQRSNRSCAQLAALAALHGEQPHGADNHPAAL